MMWITLAVISILALAAYGFSRVRIAEKKYIWRKIGDDHVYVERATGETVAFVRDMGDHWIARCNRSHSRTQAYVAQDYAMKAVVRAFS